jgi:hypothetical protein
LSSIHKRRPERCDEQEDKEDGGVLACLISTAEIGSLKRNLANERNQNTSETNQQERSTTEPFNEEGAKYVSWEC